MVVVDVLGLMVIIDFKVVSDNIVDWLIMVKLVLKFFVMECKNDCLGLIVFGFVVYF